MTKSAFLNRFAELLELPSGTLTGEEILRDLEGWDSMKLIELIAFVDLELSVNLLPEKLIKCQKINDIASLLGNNLTG